MFVLSHFTFIFCKSEFPREQVAAAAQMQEEHFKREKEFETQISTQRAREAVINDQMQRVVAVSHQEKATLEAKLAQNWEDLRQASSTANCDP